MHPLEKFLKLGYVILDEKTSYIIVFNEGGYLVPVRVFNKIVIELSKMLGLEKTRDFFKEIGKYQVKQALRRYEKIFEINKIEKDKIMDFAKEIIKMIGIGNFNIYKLDENSYEIEFEPATIFAYEAALEYKKLDFPVDFIIEGFFEQGFEIFENAKFHCEEISCYAKGDERCTFLCKKI